MTKTFTITPLGAFSLRESVEFGFGQRHSEPFAGVMRLAFVLDGRDEQVGATVRQNGDAVHVEFEGSDDAEAVKRQVARVLSLDHDGREYEAVGLRDPVIARLQAAAPGLRPPLFYSPYEAAVWSVLSARRPARQMAEVRRQLSEAYGATFELAGEQASALPTPRQLLGVSAFPGITPDKLARMHGVAEAASSGQLDVDRLVALGPEAAATDIQRLKGLGPFYSSLVVIRAVGFADVLPRDETMLRDLVTSLYELDEPCSAERLEQIAAPWRPFRTWVSVLVRAAGRRLAESPAVMPA
jgi:DNA-3-methyladenine glycosylase II